MANVFVQAGIATISYPFGYQRLLSQLGYEPFEPYLARCWFGFGREIYYLPNVFQYLRHIRERDGFFGLFRGLVPKLAGNLLGTWVVMNTQNQLKAVMDGSEQETEDEEQDELVVWLKDYFKKATQEAIAKCTGIIVSQPFHVIMVRSVAQFVGRETAYDSLWSSVKEIYNNEGILGFFAGIVPRLIGEIISIYLSKFLVQLMNKYLVPEKELQQYTGAVVGVCVSTFTYRFQLVSSIMAVNGSGLAVSALPYMEPYASWTDCYRTLQEQRLLSRGSSFTYRHYKGRLIDGKPAIAGFHKLSQWH